MCYNVFHQTFQQIAVSLLMPSGCSYLKTVAGHQKCLLKETSPSILESFQSKFKFCFRVCSKEFYNLHLKSSRRNFTLYFRALPASWSSVQGLCLLIMRSRIRFPVVPWEFFLAGKDSRGDHGLGS